MKRAIVTLASSIGKIDVDVDIPENDEERRKGLSGRAVQRGMLFQHNGERVVHYVMDGMVEPIVVLFIDVTGFVVSVDHAHPGGSISHRGPPIGWVLELPLYAHAHMRRPLRLAKITPVR